MTFTVRPDVEAWTPKLERQYRRLCLAEATGEITDHDAREFGFLSQQRKRFHPTRTEDEILFSSRQRQHTQRLVEALKAYVEFHATTAHSPLST